LGFLRTDSGQETFFHATSAEGDTFFDYLNEARQVTFDKEHDTAAVAAVSGRCG
jgi:cold shock CspA family protein